MKGVTINGLVIILDGFRDESKDYDFCSLTLACEGREYILDVCQTYTTDEVTTCRVECDLLMDKDTDTFTDCPFDLRAEDLLNEDLTAKFYMGGDFENKILEMNLYARYRGLNLTIDVTEDN